MKISKRLALINESATLKLNAAVQAMKARGEDVINLTAGEPDFQPPQAVIDAVKTALDQGRSKYTPVAGIEPLRELVAKKTNAQQSGLATAWTAKNVVVTNGGKQALFNALMALVNPGDEVLVPAPFWLSYPEMIRIAEGEPVVLETRFEDGFKLTPSSLRHVLKTTKAKGLILNSPSNPTGAAYSKEELAALGKVIREERRADAFFVISDEIYDQILFGSRPFVSFLGACPELQDQTITVNGLSKSGAMTGWRVGWSVASPAVTQAMAVLQGQATSGISSLSQAAAVASLSLPASQFSDWLKQYERRRSLALEILGKTAKIKVFPPEGAFYVFIGVKECLKSGEDSLGLAERLLRDHRVAVVPCGSFGAPDWIRISFATDERSLSEGCERIVRGLS